jgi:hypothetical protein
MTGDVSGGFNVGGLVGENYFGAITCCYATGIVRGTGDWVGGLAGYNYGMIRSCYATDAVSGTGNYVGGLVGTNEGTILSCFWDKQMSGLQSSDGGIGKSTIMMKTLPTFTSAGWDFVGETMNGTEDVWRMCGDGVSYPRLAWEFSQGGDMDCPDGVGLADLVYLAGRWMKTTSATAGAADGNRDGKVDIQDFGIVSENWMR